VNLLDAEESNIEPRTAIRIGAEQVVGDQERASPANYGNGSFSWPWDSCWRNGISTIAVSTSEPAMPILPLTVLRALPPRPAAPSP